MVFFNKSLAGPGYIILNIIRVLNILSLLAVIAASAVMLVKTFVVSKFFFFDACSHVIAATISTFLIISEISIFKGYFARNWPLFGPEAGFLTLGCSMLMLGNGVLGNLNKKATSQQSLGLAFWRIVISAGIVVIVVGVVNIFANFIFRDRKNNVTARMVRCHGAYASQKATSIHTSPSLSRRDSLPSYYSRSTVKPETRQKAPRLPLNISSPINEDENQFQKFGGNPFVQEPSLAHHPAMYSGTAENRV
ncbi:MAG: hypothetical protein Q9227_002788 [Pyrenula ochraceoflavens]